LPKGKSFILAKWVHKVKKGPRGEVDTLKAMLVAFGFQKRLELTMKKHFV
jgi:hypothetical protein